MTKRRKVHLLRASCIIITMCGCLEAFGETAPPEVVSAAKSGLRPFLEKIPAQDLRSYGFEPGAPLDTAYVGIPYRLYELTPSALARFKPGEPVSSVICPTGMWYFPVMIGNEAKAILIVDTLDGSWQAVSLGQAPLARELNAIIRQWPRERGYDPLLIVNFQSKTHLFTVPQKSDHNLTAILPREFSSGIGPRAGEQGYASTGELSKMIELLKPVVEDSILQPR